MPDKARHIKAINLIVYLIWILSVPGAFVLGQSYPRETPVYILPYVAVQLVIIAVVVVTLLFFLLRRK